jgi:hypothetical protein
MVARAAPKEAAVPRWQRVQLANELRGPVSPAGPRIEGVFCLGDRPEKIDARQKHVDVFWAHLKLALSRQDEAILKGMGDVHRWFETNNPRRPFE